MDFKPEENKVQEQVPYFEDVKAGDGWEGQGTNKSVEQLESEVFDAITRLNGGVTNVVKGTYQDGVRVRAGYRISFVLRRDDGTLDQARLDIAALPCRRPDIKGAHGTRKGKSVRVTNREAAICMMLYMLRDALKGMWFMRQLAPGYVPLMPFLLANGQDKTLSELYSAQGMFSKLLPSPKADFVEGEVIEVSSRK